MGLNLLNKQKKMLEESISKYMLFLAHVALSWLMTDKVLFISANVSVPFVQLAQLR